MIYILLPAYNEEEAVPPLVDKIAAAMTAAEAEYEIVAANDGSADRTGGNPRGPGSTPPHPRHHA